MEYKKLEFSDRTVWLQLDERKCIMRNGYKIEKYKTLNQYHLSKSQQMLGKFDSLVSAIVEARNLNKDTKD